MKRSKREKRDNLLLATSLLGGLGDLATLAIGLLDGLDDTDGDGLTHITDGETSERGVLLEGLNAERLGGNHLDDGSITRLDELGELLNGLTGTTINLLENLGELAGNVSGVAIQDGSVSVGDLTGVVQDNDLSSELFCSLRSLLFESPATNPLLSSLTDTFLTLKPTLSPGRASVSAS